MATGICKLTGEKGEFVDSHIIPKALTRPEEPGLPFIQAGQGTRPGRRWSSWYDRRLVTQAGEDILTALDTWAIVELRKHKLVWSGWGPMVALGSEHTLIPETPWGFREIVGIEPIRLRMFFLSLLWRAAASGRSEFSEVELPPADLETLRLMVLTGNPHPLSFYPTALVQLSTIGRVHNNSPFAITKIFPSIEGGDEREVPIFRFYFDGLIAHMHRHASDDGETESLGPLVVGGDVKLTLPTVPFETSFQHENLQRLSSEASDQWPNVMARLNN